MLPWEKENVYGQKCGLRYRNEEYHYVKEHLSDNPKFFLRKGDIVKFQDCRIKPYYENWQQWFMTHKDYRKTWRKDPVVPYYASNRFAVIAARTKITKFKYRTFTDYGCVVMMLTGEKAGHIRRYFMKKPFDLKIPFPRKIKYKYILKALPDYIVDIFNDDYEDSEEGRNLLLLRLNAALNKIPY